MQKSGVRKIAERYVKALFEASGDAQLQVEKDLLTLLPLLAESESLRDLIKSPLFSRAEQVKAMTLVLDKIKAHAVTRQFLALLIENKRLALLKEMIEIYCEWAISARGEMKAKAVSAAPLKAADLAAISATLGKIYQKKILLETSEAPELLGGLIVKIGGLQLDSSLAGKLNRLKQTLKAA